MAKVLLINPSYSGSYGAAKAALTTPIYPTLGLTTIAAEALRRGHQVDILDLSYRPYDWRLIRSTILEAKPDLVGITATTPLMQSVLDIAKSPSVRALLCIGFVGSLVPGIVNLSERPDYQSNRDIAEYLKENVRNLNGVLILPALPDIPSPADNRIMDTYYYLKKETLPVYLVSFGKIRTPVFVPSRGDITGVPRERDDWESTLESGRYAVLSRVPIKDCAKIPPWLKDLKAVARQSAPILPGLTVCEVDFFSDPIF